MVLIQDITEEVLCLSTGWIGHQSIAAHLGEEESSTTKRSLDTRIVSIFHQLGQGNWKKFPTKRVRSDFDKALLKGKGNLSLPTASAG